MSATAFDTHSCELGEGPLWHPRLEQLFWFDILGKTLHSRGIGGPRISWKFQDLISAAGWIDDTTLLLAYADGLCSFEVPSANLRVLAEFPKGPVALRSNDGRADRQGGFWIGTMGIASEDRAGTGAIYRYYRGELRTLYSGVAIPNAICFSVDGRTAHFAGTQRGIVWRQALDAEGWPDSEPQVYLDFSREEFSPDGAVVDADGNFWIALWGAGKVACYNPVGTLLREVGVPTGKASCPAFGGPDFSTLFVTTAREGMSEEEAEADPLAGQTFVAEAVARGVEEPRVIVG